MINIDSELVKILRINDYECSALNKTFLSSCPRLRRHPEREWKECKSWVRKECMINCPPHSIYLLNTQNQLLAAKALPKILRTFFLKMRARILNHHPPWVVIGN